MSRVQIIQMKLNKKVNINCKKKKETGVGKENRKVSGKESSTLILKFRDD